MENGGKSESLLFEFFASCRDSFMAGVFSRWSSWNSESDQKELSHNEDVISKRKNFFEGVGGCGSLINKWTRLNLASLLFVMCR